MKPAEFFILQVFLVLALPAIVMQKKPLLKALAGSAYLGLRNFFSIFNLVLRVILELNDFDKAIIVSSDGDFYSLVQYLYENNKLKVVLSPDIENCSNLLKQTAKEKIWFMNELRNKLEYKKKNTA